MVQTVMHAIMILQGKEPTWAEAKSQLGARQQQDEGMNKGRKLKGKMQEDRCIWARQREVQECGKETHRRLKCPKN